MIGLDTRWVFLAVLGLSLVAVSGSYRPGVVHRLLIAVASLVVKHRFSNYSSWALESRLSGWGAWA